MSIILRSHPGIVHSMTQETDPGSYLYRMRNAGPLSVAVSTPQVKYGVRSSKYVRSCTHWLRLRVFPPPAFGLICEGAIGQQR
jgi:hypothetical protein